MEEKTRLEKREYILQRIQDEFVYYPPSIYDICISLKMSVDGSADPHDKYVEDQMVEFLKVTLKTWDENICGDTRWGILQHSFDNCIKQLVMMTLSIYYEHNS